MVSVFHSSAPTHFPGGFTATADRVPAMALLVLLAASAAGCAGAGGAGPRTGPPAGTEEPPADTAAEAEAEAPLEEEVPEEAREARPGRSALPPIPERRGSLDLDVVYPGPRRLVRPDSNFIFGSTGTGDARLWIEGEEVQVEPNGAFLAWLPVPEADGGGRLSRYRLVARRVDPDAGRDSVVVEHPIRRPGSGYRPPAEGVWIDSTSLRLPELRWALPDEGLEFELRAAPGSRSWLEVGEERFPLDSPPGSDTYRGTVSAGALADVVCRQRESAGGGRVRSRGARSGGSGGCLRRDEALPVGLRFVASREDDTARHARELRLRVLEPDALPVAEMREAPDPVHGQNGVVVGRPIPAGPYAWRFPDGTRAEVTGRRGDRLRVSVPGGPDAWIDVEDSVLLPGGTPRPRAILGDLQVERRPDRLRLEIPLESAVPARVARSAPERLVLWLHGVSAGTQRLGYDPGDPLLEALDWTQEAGPAVRLDLRLSEPHWGYRLEWREGGPGDVAGRAPEARPGDSVELAPGRLVLEVRRPPTIDPGAPLRDRKIAVDPGHPGAGAYGPTGYYEGDANLAISRRLVRMLREEGAEPVLIRSDTLPVGLYERTERAVAAGAELFVSIHNNALPDGVYPYGEEGTSTYFYHPHARELAEALQAGMVRHMGLRDLGVFWGNLAVTRMSWMPSVLAEGAFMMIPHHEAALRTAEFQRAYARGVLDGLKEFLTRRANGGGGRR